MNPETQIRSLDELALARANKRAVVCPGLRCFAGPTPAAFAMNYTGEIIHRLISVGLFIYTPKTKTK